VGHFTSFFASAALEARSGKRWSFQRAQEIAEQVKGALVDAAGIGRVEAVKGYLNLYFERRNMPAAWSKLSWMKRLFGSGPATGQRVMVEFSNLIHIKPSTSGTCAPPFWAMHWPDH